MVVRLDQQIKKLRILKDHNCYTFLGNTILFFLLFVRCRAALAGRDDTGAGGDGSSELLGEGIHLGGGAPGGEHHGEVGSVGREDLARVVASEGDAGGKTQAFPIRAQC